MKKTSDYLVLLNQLLHAGVRLTVNQGCLNISDPNGVLIGEKAAALSARSVEVIGHLRASPGRSIADYPPENRMLTHRLQEQLIRHHRNLCRSAGKELPFPSWLEWPTRARLRQIAQELKDMESTSKSRQVQPAANKGLRRRTRHKSL